MAGSEGKQITHKSRKQDIALNIVQLTDLHLFSDPKEQLLGVNTEESFLAVLDLALQSHEKPDLMILSGDLTQDGSEEAYNRLQGYLSQLDFPCYCLPGNHDNPVLMQSILNRGNIQTSPHIQNNGWQIICLDSKLAGSEGGHLSDQELKKLSKSLADHPNLPTLIAFHHPPLPIDCPWLDTMTLDNPKALFEITNQHPQVKGLLLGHVHQEKDWQKNGVRLLATPSTCFQFKPNTADFELDQQPAGYRRLSLLASGLIETDVYRLASIPEGLNNLSNGY